jgi:adenylate cyclase
MDEMSHIIMQHDGMVDKYIGDAIMAVFGVPVKHERPEEIAGDALNAVQCALAINERLRQLNAQWKNAGLPVVTMRAGIYTGALVADSFGSSKRKEYTVIGDSVNIASRLESFDKSIATPTAQNPCRVLIGHPTYQHIQLAQNNIDAQLVGQFQLKGKAQTVEVYQVHSR